MIPDLVPETSVGRDLQIWAAAHVGSLAAASRPAPPPNRGLADLSWLNPTLLRTLHSEDGVMAASFITLSDGTLRLAGGTAGQGVQIWDPLSGTSDRSLAAESDMVSATAVTTLPDGTLLLAVGYDNGAVRIWDPLTGGCHRTLHGYAEGWSVALITQPDGTPLLAFGGDDNTVQVCDPLTGTSHHSLTGHTALVRVLAVTILPDGTTLLATGDRQGMVRIWDPASGTCRAYPDSPQ